MNAKEFFKRFRWWIACPCLLQLIVGIVLMAVPADGYLARSVAAGVLFALSGLVSVISFFLGLEENIFRLLAGVAQLSAAVWMFIVIQTPTVVLASAAAAIVALTMGGEIFDAVKHDGGKRRIARIVVSVLLIGACLAIPFDPFGSRGALLLYAGAVVAAEAAAVGSFLLAGGLFAEEEKLVFRKVK